MKKLIIRIIASVLMISMLLEQFSVSSWATELSKNATEESVESFTNTMSTNKSTGEQIEVTSVEVLTDYGEIIDLGVCNNSINWKLYDSGVLEINGSGAMKDYGLYYYEEETLGISPWAKKSNIKRVIISPTITTIGDNSFAQCSNLEEISIPEGVTKIGKQAFYKCSSLTSIELPKTLTRIYGLAFAYCTSLTSINIPENVTEIQNQVFQNCSALREVELPNGITEIPSSLFLECKSLCKVNIPYGVTKIGHQAFYKCSSLISIEIPDSVSETLMSDMFKDCKNLTHVKLSKSMPRIPTSCFEGCVKLKTIEIPESVEIIDYDAFSGCTGLESLILKGGIKKIVDSAFKYCTNLKEIYYEKDMASWENVIINDGNSCLINATLYYNSIGPITSVTKTTNLNNENYGVYSYKNTLAGDVRDRANDFIEAMNNYLTELKVATEKDIKSANISKNKKSKGDILKEKVKGLGNEYITISTFMPEEAEAALYDTLAEFYNECCEKANVDLDRIDMSAQEFIITEKMVKNALGGLGRTLYAKNKNGYTVEIDEISNFDAGFASITVSKNRKTYIALRATNLEYTAKVLTIYANAVAGWTEDALEEARESLVKELGNLTGIGDLLGINLQQFFEGKVEVLQKNGYGDILNYWLLMKKGYQICKSITIAEEGSSLLETLDEVNDIHDNILSLDFSDDSITNEIISEAVREVDKEKRLLEEALKKYKENEENIESDTEYSWWERKWNSSKSIDIQCPVDFVVYDGDNNEIGRVEDGIVTTTSDIFIKRSGDVKCIIIPQGLDVRIEFIGTDVGTMNYVVEQTVDGKVTGRAIYYGVPLSKGGTFSHNISGGDLREDSSEPLISENEIYDMSEYVSADDSEGHYEIKCDAHPGGVVIGTGKYAKGSPVELLAQPKSDEFRFVGWYVDDVLVEINSIYRFSATSDISVEAVFEERKECDENYYSVMSDAYETVADILIYKNMQDEHDIIFNMFGLEDITELNVLLKAYNDSELVKSELVQTVYDGTFRFEISKYELSEFSKIEIYDEEGQLIGSINYNAPNEQLAFSTAGLTLHDDLTINFKAKKSLFEETGYTEPYALFVMNGVETKVSKYTESGDYYVFRFKDIAPNQMKDVINVTLHATYNDVDYSSKLMEYSVLKYCNTILKNYSGDAYGELRTLIVDLLEYGAKSQLYTDYNINNLVNSDLTDDQKAWGTSGDRILNTVLDTKYETISNPTASWKTAGLNLKEAITMRFKIATDDIEGLSVKIVSEKGDTWMIPASDFKETDGGFYVLFNELNAGRMSETIYLTVEKNGVAVSNTLSYSIESYVYTNQNSADIKLSELVKALIKYGDSAYNYVN